MRVTRYTDYALRVLIFLGLKGEELSTIKEIADSYGISKNHLMKVVHHLQQTGYIDTIRGKHGGMRLRLSPEQINVGALVRQTEQDLNIVECFGPDNTCVITPSCELKFVLNDALKAFLSVLDGYTLADLLGSQHRQGLARTLNLQGIPIAVE